MADSPEKIAYFVRHGECEDNPAPVYSRPSSSLSQKGREQAELIAERVSHLSFDVLISSPLPRTKSTAEAIARKTGKGPEYAELFVEAVMPGALAGKSYDDPGADDLWLAWEKSLFTSGVRAMDGEGLDDLMARADQALSYLEQRPERSMVVVTHAYFIRCLMMRVLLGELLTDDIALRFKRLLPNENTAISAIRYESDPDFEDEPCWRVWIYNDHAHLG